MLSSSCIIYQVGMLYSIFKLILSYYVVHLVSLVLQHNNKLRKEAEKRGEKFKVHKLRRNEEMDEYDFIHWRRSFEEREALIRDISWYVF